jgi:SAM-dependent methyltransferase
VRIAPALQHELDRASWMYPWPIAPGVVAPLHGRNLPGVHRTRTEMIEPAVRAALAAAGPGACAIDLACNEGWFAHLLLEWGAERVVGVDIRASNVRRAELIRDHYGIPSERLELIQADVLALDPARLGRFDVVLMLGLIYHMEQPLEALRIARRLTDGVCVVESQLVRDTRPLLFTDGVPNDFKAVEMVFGAWHEDQEENPLASSGQVISLVPNLVALERMPRLAGFGRVELLDAAPHHDPQYVHRDRGIVVAHARIRTGSAATGLPLPPVRLARRVGDPLDGIDPLAEHEAAGERVRDQLEALLPEDWTWEGRRVLDFGCGIGRVLRQFHREAGTAHFEGCDIHRESVDWINANLQPPFRAFAVAEEPGLPHGDGELDLVWAASVFTHLTDHWAGWLAELQRVLAPGGLLIASFLGRNMGERFLGPPWEEDRVGMLTIARDVPWDAGGPAVFHSEWWLRAHWGRAFEFITLDHRPDDPDSHGWMLLRARPEQVSPAELQRPADDPRELDALQLQIERLELELRAARDSA